MLIKMLTVRVLFLARMNLINIRSFPLQRFKGTESISKVSEQVKNVKLNEDKPKETKSEETLDEVCI